MPLVLCAGFKGQTQVVAAEKCASNYFNYLATHMSFAKPPSPSPSCRILTTNVTWQRQRVVEGGVLSKWCNMRLSMTGTETWTCLTLALAKLSPGCCSACHMSIDSSTGLACWKRDRGRLWEWEGCVVVLKSVCAAKADTLLHPKRQIACSVKLCVKCKIPRLRALKDTASP